MTESDSRTLDVIDEHSAKGHELQAMLGVLRYALAAEAQVEQLRVVRHDLALDPLPELQRDHVERLLHLAGTHAHDLTPRP